MHNGPTKVASSITITTALFYTHKQTVLYKYIYIYIYIIPPYDPDKTGIVSLDSQLEEVSWCFEPSQPKGLLNQDWFEEVNQLVYPERRVQDEGSVRAKPKSFTREGQTDHSRPTSLYVKTASGREGAGR